MNFGIRDAGCRRVCELDMGAVDGAALMAAKVGVGKRVCGRRCEALEIYSRLAGRIGGELVWEWGGTSMA